MRDCAAAYLLCGNCAGLNSVRELCGEIQEWFKVQSYHQSACNRIQPLGLCGGLYKLQAALAPVVDRYKDSPLDAQSEFRGCLVDYVRLYAFLSQVIAFADADLEKLCAFAKLLWRLLPVNREPLPVVVQQNIDLDTFRVKKTSSGKITLEKGTKELDPMLPEDDGGTKPEDIEPLSQIIHELNERFGTDFTERLLERILVPRCAKVVSG